jgi:hypothetical protein
MIIDKLKIVPVGYDIDINGGTNNYGASINMKNYHKATFICQYIDLGTASHTVLFYSGAAVSTYSSALPFKYVASTAAVAAVTTATANQDVFGAKTPVAATGLAVVDTKDYYCYVFEVDADDMDIANQEEWLSIDFQDTGDAGATGQAVVIAILEPRYTQSQSATALA